VHRGLRLLSEDGRYVLCSIEGNGDGTSSVDVLAEGDATGEVEEVCGMEVDAAAIFTDISDMTEIFRDFHKSFTR